MKKCPQCNTTYSNEVIYCLNDGTPLVEDNFSLPSTVANLREEETVIRHEPIVIAIPEEKPQNVPVNYQTLPDTQNVITELPPKRASRTLNYALFLILGLIIGGGLVLGTLFFARNFYRNDNKNANKALGKNNNQPEKTPTGKAQNTNQISPTPTETIVSRNHDERSDADDDDFNGRVITLNAFVRSSPSKTATQIDILPMNDRINIEERENPNSPWFHITCEHGTSGWMHGDTIEFTK